MVLSKLYLTDCGVCLQVISLTIASRFGGEPQEIVVRPGASGSADGAGVAAGAAGPSSGAATSSSASGPASASGAIAGPSTGPADQFRSPNVVAPVDGDPIPPFPPSTQTLGAQAALSGSASGQAAAGTAGAVTANSRYENNKASVTDDIPFQTTTPATIPFRGLFLSVMCSPKVIFVSRHSYFVDIPSIFVM